MQRSILVIEDELPILETIRLTLERDGHHVFGVRTTAEARQILGTEPVALALIDWMLPGTSGLEFVRSLRRDERTRRLPLIMLTARSDDEDISAGLDAGADDYLCKPFSPRELASRVRALLRRSEDFQPQERLLHGALRVDVQSERVFAESEPVALNPLEFRLLVFLLRHPERVFSRSHLLDSVWGIDSSIDERTVDVHILRLRKRLKPHGLDGLIETVRGSGYRLAGRPSGAAEQQ